MAASDFQAVIATLYRPDTLDKILEDLCGQGVKAHVIEGLYTNEAWNKGLGMVKTRYAIVLNDDIYVPETDVDGDSWVDALQAHHSAGYSWVTARLYWRKRHSRASRVPMRSGKHNFDLGHCFSMDMSVDVPPVPPEMKIAFGDNWFFEHHAMTSKCCRALDLVVATGYGVGHDDHSGYTINRCREEGTDHDSVQAEDHKAARRFFEFGPKGEVISLRQKVFAGHA